MPASRCRPAATAGGLSQFSSQRKWDCPLPRHGHHRAASPDVYMPASAALLNHQRPNSPHRSAASLRRIALRPPERSCPIDATRPLRLEAVSDRRDGTGWSRSDSWAASRRWSMPACPLSTGTHSRERASPASMATMIDRCLDHISHHARNGVSWGRHLLSVGQTFLSAGENDALGRQECLPHRLIGHWTLGGWIVMETPEQRNAKRWENG